MRYYPIFLDLRGRRSVVVGGGKVAERKVRGLLRAQSAVRVISPDLTPRLVLLARKKKISVTRRCYRKGDLDAGSPEKRPMLVFAATDDPRTQQALRDEAEAVGVLVNVADNRERSSFLVPASFAQGDLQVAISTSGASPTLARVLRRELQETLGPKYRELLRALRAARERVKQSVGRPSDRVKVLRQLAAQVREVKS